jgi:hypothetical protein
MAKIIRTKPAKGTRRFPKRQDIEEDISGCSSRRSEAAKNRENAPG